MAAPLFMAPGNVVRARYRLRQLLGEGGMGAVFEAEDLELRRPCALKVLQARLVGDATVYRRFLREAEFAAGLEHEHVVRVFDRGELADGVPFYTMELLRGRSLADVAAEGPIGWRRARHIALQLCRVLGLVHGRRIVHRDLKPDNCFLVTLGDDEDFLKLLDFGLARADADGGDPRLTTTSEVLGTALYMSPQQARGEQVDHRADVYAVGVILYQLLTGVVPFARANALQVLEAIKNETPPPPSYHNPQLPPAVDELVARAMHKELELRHQSARELQAAIAAIPADAVVAGAVAAGRAPPPRVHTPTALAMTQAAVEATTTAELAGAATEVTAVRRPASAAAQGVRAASVAAAQGERAASVAAAQGERAASVTAQGERAAGVAAAQGERAASVAVQGERAASAATVADAEEMRRSVPTIGLMAPTLPTLTRRRWPLVAGVLGLAVVLAAVLLRSREAPVVETAVGPGPGPEPVAPAVVKEELVKAEVEAPTIAAAPEVEETKAEAVAVPAGSPRKKPRTLSARELEEQVRKWAAGVQKAPPGDCAKIVFSKKLEFAATASKKGALALTRTAVKPENTTCAAAVEKAFERAFRGKVAPEDARTPVTLTFGKGK